MLLRQTRRGKGIADSSIFREQIAGCFLDDAINKLNTAMDEMLIVQRQAADVSDLLGTLSPAAWR